MFVVTDMSGYKHFLVPGFNIISIEEGLIQEKRVKIRELEEQIKNLRAHLEAFSRWIAGGDTPQWESYDFIRERDNEYVVTYRWNVVPHYEEKKREELRKLEANLATLNAMKLPRWQIQVVLHNKVIDINIYHLPIWVGDNLSLHA